jgi:hypothetical protein
LVGFLVCVGEFEITKADEKSSAFLLVGVVRSHRKQFGCAELQSEAGLEFANGELR